MFNDFELQLLDLKGSFSLKCHEWGMLSEELFSAKTRLKKRSLYMPKHICLHIRRICMHVLCFCTEILLFCTAVCFKHTNLYYQKIDVTLDVSKRSMQISIIKYITLCLAYLSNSHTSPCLVYFISILGQEILMEMNVLLSEGLAVDQRRMFMLSHKALLPHTKQCFT